jgi:hypothetical protein
VVGFIALILAGFVAAAMLGGHGQKGADECSGATMQSVTASA